MIRYVELGLFITGIVLAVIGMLRLSAPVGMIVGGGILITLSILSRKERTQ